MTTVLNAYSIAYPLITNRIRASVYLQSSPQALVASIIDSVAGHPARVWSFPGLPRNNYGFIMEEINSSDQPVNTLANFDVVPGEVDGSLTREHEQIRVGTTPGLNAGDNEFTFDGSETSVGSGIYKPNYIGWNIVIAELEARGILTEDLEYSWNRETGNFKLLTAGDSFNIEQFYNVQFDPVDSSLGNSYPTITDFIIRLVTTTSNILTSDFGGKLIVEPNGNYIELTLPNINTVVEGRKLMVEVGGNNDCSVRFLPNGSDILNFLNGKLIACVNESFSIYCFSRNGVKEWRVCDLNGNFKTVGQLVSTDDDTVVNGKQLVGSSINANQYARLYDYVLDLPLNQVIAYDAHELTVQTKCMYSFVGSNGEFYIPDRRDLFERNSSATQPAGNYHKDTIINHKHEETLGELPVPPFGQGTVRNPNTGNYHGTGNEKYDYTSNPIDDNGVEIGDTETQPKNYRANKFVLV